MATASKETGKTSIENRQRLSNKNILKKLMRRDTVAVLAGTAALAGSLAPAETAAASLRPVHELPGYGKKVSPEQSARLKASTVTIIKRLKDAAPEYQYWQEDSTGVKVRVSGKKGSYILSDGHAFAEATGSKSGVFTSPMERGAPAENVINQLSYEYAIARPKTDSDQSYYPLQKVSGISVSLKNTDAALLSVTRLPAGWGVNPDTAERHYNALPALSTKRLASHRPEPGQEVALYGASQVNIGVAGASKATYLGRIEQGHRKLDMFGIRAANPQTDPFNFGRSGGSALFAEGAMSGPQSIRINLGYGKDHALQPFNVDLPMKDEQCLYNEVQKDLGVKLSGFNTIGGASVVSQQTVHEMAGGFNHYPVTVNS
jgi:hypothetical protein